MASTPTVLVIDDVPESREILGWILQHASFEVVQACDGIDGLQKAREVSPDVIVTDIVMPRLDGLALAQRLRSQEETAGIPIVATTGSVEDVASRDHFAEAFDAFLMKPVGPAELTRVVSRLLRERADDGSLDAH